MRRFLALAAMAAAILFTPPTIAPSLSAQHTGVEDASGIPCYAPPDVTVESFTGDWDGILERQHLRILVPYSRTFYFVDRATQHGVIYEAFKLFEEDLNKELRKKHMSMHVIFVPVARDRLIPALMEGRGDVAAADLTITPERLKQIDFTAPVGRDVSEIVVTGPDIEPINTVQDLSGKEVYVRKSSSFHESLEALNAEFAKTGGAPVRVRLAPEDLEMEDILEMVNAGLVGVTIADDYLAAFWKQIFTKLTLNRNAVLRTNGDTAWMIRKKCPILKATLNAFIARYPEGSRERTRLERTYFEQTKFAKEATSKEEIAKFDRMVQFFRQYGNKYGLDHLLMMAQGYQESQLNQEARSPLGAIGVMQVMPATGKHMAVGDITQLEPNIHAGIKYIRSMMSQLYEGEPMSPLDKGFFTFASYNMGPGRLAQLRVLAAKQGFDPNAWFDNVERIAAEKVGLEPVQYISNIYKYYLAYRLVTERRLEREKARQAARSCKDK